MNSEEKIELKIGLELRVNYIVFDLSGTLPFRLIYSIARPWPIEKDNPPNPLPSYYIDKPLSFRVSKSLLDVPFALKNGYVRFIDKGTRASVDFSDIELRPCNPEQVTLGSGAGSSVRWRNRTIDICYQIDPSGQIGKKFQPGHLYRLELPENETTFPVEYFALSDTNGDPADVQTGPSNEISLYHQGRVRSRDFKAVPSLTEQPRVYIKLLAGPDIRIKRGESFNFKAEVTNISGSPLIFRTHGRQIYLAPEGRYGPHVDDRPRLEATRSPSSSSSRSDIHSSNFSIKRVSTEEEIIPEYHDICSVPVSGPSPGYRISRGAFKTLEPGVSVIKETALADIIPRRSNLEPGEYNLTLVPLDAQWHPGTLQDVFGENTIVEYDHWATMRRLPVHFWSDDEIVFHVE